jgi:hypothetical protein
VDAAQPDCRYYSHLQLTLHSFFLVSASFSIPKKRIWRSCRQESHCRKMNGSATLHSALDRQRTNVVLLVPSSSRMKSRAFLLNVLVIDNCTQTSKYLPQPHPVPFNTPNPFPFVLWHTVPQDLPSTCRDPIVRPPHSSKLPLGRSQSMQPASRVTQDAAGVVAGTHD